LPKNNDEFGLAIPKLRKNTLLNMSNTFLEVIVKIVTVAIWKIL